VHHVGILYGQFMMHGQRNIKNSINSGFYITVPTVNICSWCLFFLLF